MNNDFYLVSKKLLPDFIDSIIKIKEEIANNINISDACKKEHISRSTFYKYKDLVFKTNNRTTCVAIFSFKALNETGVLSAVLQLFADSNANILTVNQDMPINNYAFITIAIDINNINISLDGLIEKLKSQKNIKKVELVAFEG